jgi:hypothetical protein
MKQKRYPTQISIVHHRNIPLARKFLFGPTRRNTMPKDELNAGFTGTPTEPQSGVRKAATNAVDAVKREANAVTSGAAEHPHTATGLVLGISALAFMIGYALGKNSVSDSYRYWR